MVITMDKKEAYRKEIEERKKKKKNITTIMGVLLGLEIINILYFVIYTFELINIPDNFYSKHICIPFAILVVGVLALLIPVANKYGSFKSSTSNDKYISLGGIILLFASIVMFIGSFI